MTCKSVFIPISQDPSQRIFLFFIFKETRHHYRQFRKYRKEIEKMSSTPWSRTVVQSSRDSAFSFPSTFSSGSVSLFASGCCCFTAPPGRPGPDHLRKALRPRNHRVQLHTPPSLPAFYCSRDRTPTFQGNVPLSLGLKRDLIQDISGARGCSHLQAGHPAGGQPRPPFTAQRLSVSSGSLNLSRHSALPDPRGAQVHAPLADVRSSGDLQTVLTLFQ